MGAEEQSARRSMREASSQPRSGPHVSFGEAPPVAEAEQVRRQLEALLEELDRREQNLNCQLSLLDRERRAETLRQQRRDAELDEREQEIARREADLQAERAQIDARQSKVAAQESRLIREQEEWQERRRQLETDWDEQTQHAQSAIEQARGELAADRDAFEAERREQATALERREADVTQREVDLEKRHQFQQQHLARLRCELTEQAADLVRDRQRVELWSEQVRTTVGLRLRQLRRFRELLDRREADCERGWEELRERRKNDQATLIQLRQQLADDRKMLIEERIALEQQFRRRHEQLDRREAELLRGGDYVASTDDSDAPANVSSNSSLRATEQAYDDLERRKLQWQIETEDAARLLSLREDRLREQEASLARHARHLADRAAAWTRDQQQRREERRQAERLIRGLLDELADRLV